VIQTQTQSLIDPIDPIDAQLSLACPPNPMKNRIKTQS
jgi:hypothetical protein